MSCNEYPRLEGWRLVAICANPHIGPYPKPRQAKGRIYGHPRFEDGAVVTTADILSVSGRVIKTRDSTIELGEAAPEYAAKFQIDPDNPITVQGLALAGI